MKKLLLIDGNNLASRVFFTKNSYNIINTLNYATNTFKINSVVFLWDRECYYRKNAYPDYKANRKTNPARTQYVTTVEEIVQESGHICIAEDGYEADDLIYSVVLDNSKDFDIYVLSTDKDLLGLIQYGAKVILPKNKGKFELVTKLPHEYDYYEFKALVGDPSDNLPGATGVGSVRANKLLEKYGNLGSLLESNEDRIINQVEQIATMHDLVSPIYCMGLVLDYNTYDSTKLRRTIAAYT